VIITGSLDGRRSRVVPGATARQTSRHAERRRRTLVGQSLRAGSELEGIPLTVTKVSRVRVADEPELSTLICFDVTADRAAGLAEAACLNARAAGTAPSGRARRCS
jgi:hypothetical protein